MKPMITLQRPFEDVSLIKIYEPKMPDDQTIVFLVCIDGTFKSIALKADGSWIIENVGEISQRIIDFICIQIQLLFIKPESAVRDESHTLLHQQCVGRFSKEAFDQ